MTEKIRDARAGGNDCCPYGRGLANTKLTELDGMNRIARRVYENILVKCIDAKNGCTWHGKISELQQHRECGCLFISGKDLYQRVKECKIIDDTLTEKSSESKNVPKVKNQDEKLDNQVAEELGKSDINKPETVSCDICNGLRCDNMMTYFRSNKPLAFKSLQSWTVFICATFVRIYSDDRMRVQQRMSAMTTMTTLTTISTILRTRMSFVAGCIPPR